MTASRDWIAVAAQEIAETADVASKENIDTFASIIEKHCPFDRDVAYEPVRLFTIVNSGSKGVDE